LRAGCVGLSLLMILPSINHLPALYVRFVGRMALVITYS